MLIPPFLYEVHFKMPGLYANKFTVEINDIARLICIDERAPVAQGMPMSSTASAEIVMTRANFIALADHLHRVAAKLREKGENE